MQNGGLNKMKEPKKLNVKDSDYYGDSLTVSHLDDTMKVHVMAMSYGELSSASLNKTQVKKLVNWLNRWLKYKDSLFTRTTETKK